MKPTDFKRLVGVKKETFALMLEVCEEYHKAKKRRGGKPTQSTFAMCLRPVCVRASLPSRISSPITLYDR